MRSPSFSILSLVLVKTGDHSISNCDGGGISVTILPGVRGPPFRGLPVVLGLDEDIGCELLDIPLSWMIFGSCAGGT